VLFLNPGDAGGRVVKRDKAQLGSTFTITTALSAVTKLGDFFNPPAAGLVVTDGTKNVAFAYVNRTDYWFLTINNWTSGTVLNASILFSPMDYQFGAVIWMKIVQDASNMTFYLGLEGRDWLQVFQTTATAWLTSTRYGMFTSNTAATPMTAVFYSFTETSP
jgi:hypothetical protein